MTITFDSVAAPVQLVDSYLHEAEIRRESPKPEDEEGPTLGVLLHEPTWIGDDHRRFGLLLEAQVNFPFNERRAVARLTCGVLGIFASPDELSMEDVAEWSQVSGIVLLYPYLRATVGQLWRMTGLNVPPLPTIDVLKTVQLVTADRSEAVAAARPARKKRSRARRVAETP